MTSVVRSSVRRRSRRRGPPAGTTRVVMSVPLISVVSTVPLVVVSWRTFISVRLPVPVLTVSLISISVLPVPVLVIPVSSLPRAVGGLRSVSYENTILVTGGGSYSGENSVDQILEYNPGRDQWNTIGHMNTSRSGHGVGLVNVDDFAGCQ